MKIETNPNINWNAAPFSMDNKIPKEIRDPLCKRFEVAISNLRDTDGYRNLLLENGWVISSKDNVVFILNSNENEDLPNNADLKDETLNSGALGAKLRRIRDKAWECEKYSDMAKIDGLTLNPSTGKISYKLV